MSRRQQFFLVLSGMILSIYGMSDESKKIIPVKDFRFESGKAEPVLISRAPFFVRKFKAYVDGKELYGYERDMARSVIKGDGPAAAQQRKNEEEKRREFDKQETFTLAPQTTHIAILKDSYQDTVKLFQIQTLKEPKKYQELAGLSLNRNKNASSAKKFTFLPDLLGNDVRILFREGEKKACLILNVPCDDAVSFEKERAIIGDLTKPAHWKEVSRSHYVDISCVEASSEKEANTKLSALHKQFTDLFKRARDGRAKLELYGEPFEWEYLAIQEPVGAPHQKKEESPAEPSH